MSRFALALALTLVAGSVHAQTDSRTNPNAPLPTPSAPRSGGFGESARAVEHWAVGERAPDFELLTAAGARFLLHESRGRWVALFFTDRRDELPHIAGLARTLDSLNVRTLAVCHEKLHSLAVSNGQLRASTLVALADERGDISALYGLWENVGGATRPGFFLIDPNGVIRTALVGQKVNAPSLPGLVQSAAEGL
jgi:peroxiredoxin